MACPNLGKNARIALGGTNYVARMTALSITINNGNQDVTEFGIDWEKFCQTIQNWVASLEGYYDRAGDVTQDQLQSIAVSAGTIDNLRLFEDITGSPSYYWTPDTATDANATCFVESYSWQADPSGIVTFSMSIKGNGPIWRTDIITTP